MSIHTSVNVSDFSTAKRLLVNNNNNNNKGSMGMGEVVPL